MSTFPLTHKRPALLMAFRLTPSRERVDALRHRAGWIRKTARRMGFGPDMCSVYDGIGMYGFTLYVWRLAFHVQVKQA